MFSRKVHAVVSILLAYIDEGALCRDMTFFWQHSATPHTLRNVRDISM